MHSGPRSSESLLLSGKASAKRPANVDALQYAATVQPKAGGELVWSPRMTQTVAARHDVSLGVATIKGYRPAFGIYIAFLEECMPTALPNPFLNEWELVDKVRLLSLYLCWLNGDYIPESGTTSELRGVPKSEVSGLANVKRLSQGLSFEFSRVGASSDVFRDNGFLAVRQSYHMDPREMSKARETNLKLPANWEMLAYVADQHFNMIINNPLQLASFVSPPPLSSNTIGLDICMTGLGLWHSGINISRVGEYAYTGKGSADHAMRHEDISIQLTIEVTGGVCRGLLFPAEVRRYRLEVGRPLVPTDVEDVVLKLRSNKVDQLGTKTRITSIQPVSARAIKYIDMLLTFIEIKGGDLALEEPFFSRHHNGRFKRLTSQMVNDMWKDVGSHFSLPANALSSKSGKQMGIMALDSMAGGRAPPEASFHASASAQNHYRHPPNGVTGNNSVLNDESGGHSMEYIRHLALINYTNENEDVEEEDEV